MNKELSPLESLYNLYARASVHCPVDEIGIILDELHIIETTLKRLEKIDNIGLIIVDNPSPNESALNKLINERMYVCDPQETEIKPLYDEVIDKKLKALEIIKEKEVDVGWLKRAKDLHKYNSGMGINSYCALTQEEYDLLKEVLL